MQGYRLLNKTGLQPVNDYVIDKDTNEFIDYNPKSYDVRRGIRTPIDRPSTTGSVNPSDIYTLKYLDNYTPFNVNNGQIQYYIDRSIKDAFYEPIYDIPNYTIRYDYIDPMGSYKPHYNLIQKQCDIDSYSPLSFIQDTSFFRENLMAAQQAINNQQRITPFYT